MHRIEPYKDASGQWRWRLLAPNGRIVADGAEAYTRKADAVRAIKAVKAAFKELT